MTPSQQPSWADEFDSRFVHLQGSPGAIKDFIAETIEAELKKQKNQIIEMLETEYQNVKADNPSFAAGIAWAQSVIVVRVGRKQE